MVRPSWRWLHSHPAYALVLAGGAVTIILGLAWLLEAHPTAPIDSYAECVRAGYPVQESSPPVCRTASHAFVGPGGSPQPSAEAAVSQTTQLLVDGDTRNQYPAHQTVIHTQAQWQHYWREVHAGLPVMPPLIPVDFTASVVVALGLGSQPTGGFNIKITDVLTSSSGTTIDVMETRPGPRCVVTQAATNPYYIARTSPVVEPISFRVTHAQHPC